MRKPTVRRIDASILRKNEPVTRSRASTQKREVPAATPASRYCRRNIQSASRCAMHAIKTNQSRASAKRRRKAVLAGCSAVVFGLSCPALAAAANHVVTAMPNLTFSPKTLTINAGDTVTFTNEGGFHNVASDPGAVTAFRCANGCDGAGGNGSLSSAAWSATVTFPKAGSASFHCEAHGAAGGVGMSGTITIKGVAVQKTRYDFNSDGKSDILWRNGSTGARIRSGFPRIRRPSRRCPPSPTCPGVLAGSGDYTGDGRADILWHNESTGANSILPSANYSAGSRC
ncbi:MAG: plastocyanin/azurin family copper-binding protein [Lysobacterales bacterium]